MSAAPVFQVRTTNELEPAEITALAQLFEIVFGKPCPEDLFVRKFARSPMGHSIHSLMFLDGQLIGAFSAIPVPYRFFGQTLKFAITAGPDDTPRATEARWPEFKSSATASTMRLPARAWLSSSAAFATRYSSSTIPSPDGRRSGRFFYYAAPATALARAAVRVWNQRAPEPHEAAYEIEKIGDAGFTDWRYRIFPTHYTTVSLPDGATAIYATDLYYPISGIPPQLRTGILIDVSPLTKMNFDAAVSQIREQERPALSILAYQGYLRFFSLHDMLRIPAKYEKQPWTLAGKILIPGQVNARIFRSQQLEYQLI